MEMVSKLICAVTGVVGTMLLFLNSLIAVGVVEGADTMWWWKGVTFPEQGFGQVKSFCPVDRQISGGGFVVDENIVVVSSIPIHENGQDGWLAEAYEATADGDGNRIWAYAVCAK